MNKNVKQLLKPTQVKSLNANMHHRVDDDDPDAEFHSFILEKDDVLIANPPEQIEDAQIDDEYFKKLSIQFYSYQSPQELLRQAEPKRKTQSQVQHNNLKTSLSNSNIIKNYRIHQQQPLKPHIQIKNIKDMEQKIDYFSPYLQQPMKRTTWKQRQSPQNQDNNASSSKIYFNDNLYPQLGISKHRISTLEPNEHEQSSALQSSPRARLYKNNLNITKVNPEQNNEGYFHFGFNIQNQLPKNNTSREGSVQPIKPRIKQHINIRNKKQQYI